MENNSNPQVVPSVTITEEDLSAALRIPIRTHVRVSGLSKIHPKVIAKDLEIIKRCGTMEEIVASMIDIKNRWLGMGIFNAVKYNFEPTLDGDGKCICVHLNVEEARAKKSIGVFTTDTSLPEVTVALENILGGRYSVKGNYIPPASRVHALSFSVLSNVPWIGQGAEYFIGKRTDSKSYHLAHSEKIDEVRLTTTSNKGSFASELTIGFQRRALQGKGAEEIPEEFKKDFTPTDKGYLKHMLTWTSVAHHAHPYLYNMYPLPIYGTQVHVTNEVAGGPMGGDTALFKTEFQGTKYWPLGPFFSLQWNSRVAGVYSFFGNRLQLNDRLFLSNCNVRGFKSIGPSTLDIGDNVTRFAATGGNALWASSLSLNFPFLFFPNNGIAAMHLFANAGNMRMVDSYESLTDAYSWLRKCAVSVGGGIVITRMPLFGVAPSGRFEINCSIPVGLDKEGNVVLRNGRKSLFDRFRFGLVWSSNLTF